MINHRFFFIHIILFSLISGSSIEPSTFNLFVNESLNDTKIKWENISIFKNSFLLQQNSKNFKKLDKKYSLNINFINEKLSGNLIFFVKKNNFYSYSILFFGEQNSLLKNHNYFKNSNKNNSRNYLRTQFSGVGFKNDWVDVKICRGNEDWGAGNNVSLALNHDSDSYDYFKLNSNYGNIRVNYIYGFLEKTPLNISRFITAKGIEWTNKRSFNIGLSETIIYSGPGRGFDLGYLNPISSHIEVELNDRLTIVGPSNSNALWQIHVDKIVKNRFRISLNYLIDEFVIDKDLENNKQSGVAGSFRVSYNIFDSLNYLLSVNSKFVFVGTNTFRHIMGENNFVLNNNPIGWSSGSDAKHFSLGLNFTDKRRIFFSLCTGVLFSGSENIKNNSLEPYKSYEKGPFPSGIVEKTEFFSTIISFKIKKNYEIKSIIDIPKKNQFHLLFGVSFYM